MKRALKMFFLLVVIIGAAFLLAQFFNQNPEKIHLEFFDFQTRELQKGVFAGVVFLCGAGFASIFLLSVAFSKTWEASRLRRENSALQRLIELSAHSHNTAAGPSAPATIEHDHSSSSKI